MNVEYNQLDPLLRSTEEFKDGDVNDASGFSPFPGNINQLVFRLDAYNKILDRTKGVMPEFVNPKYKDDAKMVFKKPTRLECMMQDFPTVLEAADSKKVGFTQAAAEICFSPVKNNLVDGAALQAAGIAAGTAATVRIRRASAHCVSSLIRHFRSIGRTKIGFCRLTPSSPTSRLLVL